LVELVIREAVDTFAAIGSPPGVDKHRKRYEQLGYSDPMAIRMDIHSFMLVQREGLAECPDFVRVRTMSFPWNTALGRISVPYDPSFVKRDIPDKAFTSCIPSLDLLVDVNDLVNIRASTLRD
jgi:hypothetical protein